MQTNLFLSYFFLFLGSLAIGSFLNVVIYRLPYQWFDFLEETSTSPKPQSHVSFFASRSYCPACQTNIKYYHNIPLFSFIMLKARCRYCQHPIPWRYFWVELLSALLPLWAAYTFGFTLALGFLCCFFWGLIALAFIDFDHFILPDEISQPLLWLGLFGNTFFYFFTDGKSALLGAVFGYLSLWSIYWVFKLLTQKEGMGYGDFKLLALLGAWLGWQQLPFIIIISASIGAVIGSAYLWFNRKSVTQTPIPFGPYLILAGILALFWGKELTQLYWNWLRF